MTDLTKITTPFGLLDAETQEALKAHGGPYECFIGDSWEEIDASWGLAVTYRVKPQPPKPREWLMSSNCISIMSVKPSTNVSHYKSLGWVHVREVLDD